MGCPCKLAPVPNKPGTVVATVAAGPDTAAAFVEGDEVELEGMAKGPFPPIVDGVATA